MGIKQKKSSNRETRDTTNIFNVKKAEENDVKNCKIVNGNDDENERKKFVFVALVDM